jgi:putative ABC transport system permease protein
MSLFGLVLRNISGSGLRSWLVTVCVLLLVGFSLFTTTVIRGAEESLRLGIDRLGADIVVVPEGSEGRVETALLMGKPVTVRMPDSVLKKIAGLPGVQTVSPQLYLASLAGASCCSVSEMFVVALDPRTDFTIRPWLDREPGRTLKMGEVIGGSNVFAPDGEDGIKLYGSMLKLAGNLEPTGTGMDQTMFFNFETAQEVSRLSRSLAERPLEIAPNSISSVMVRVVPGADAPAVALWIMHEVPGVTAIESPNLFQAYRKQMTGLLRGVLAILVVTWALAVALIGLVFSITAHERRREIAVLRALGSSRSFVFRLLLAEAAGLAVVGGLLGLGTAVLAVFLFRDLVMVSLGIPFALPTLASLPLLGGGLLLALASVTLAALFPALRISGQDPALAMRE